jgi:hydroxysqualene dehydroxylase
MKVLIAGAGWAGLACAIELTKAGHHATVLEASRAVGGRARSLSVTLPDGSEATLDNGQHILIGAYSETLRLMREVGVNPQEVLHRMPLTLRFPNGDALQLPDWRKPLIKGLDVAYGVMMAKGWSLADKFSLLQTAISWSNQGYECEPHVTVSKLCQRVSPRVMQMLIEPLCVSALNTPAHQASGQVFLRVMRDSLFADAQPGMGSSNFLLPNADLGSLFPRGAQHWLEQRGSKVLLGHRLVQWQSLSNREHLAQISIAREADMMLSFDAIVIATSPTEAIRIIEQSKPPEPWQKAYWLEKTRKLEYEPIATVYAYAKDHALPAPIMALQSSPEQPAQFVFDRGALTGQHGLMAFVVSASRGSAQEIEAQVIAQGRLQLSLPDLAAVQTIVDKRATFACTPALERPNNSFYLHPHTDIENVNAPRVLIAGDYAQGPYPSTLEGALRSGVAAANRLISA